MIDIKVLGAVGSIGTIVTGGGVYLAFKESKNTSSISDLFQREKGLKLMSKSDDPKWDEAWERYRNDHKNSDSSYYKDRDVWGIPNWKSKRNEARAFEEFKKECEKRSKMKVTDTNKREYKEVKKYCSRPKKVSELLFEEGGSSLLDKDGDEKEWGNAWSRYKQSHIANSSESTTTYKSSNEWGFTELIAGGSSLDNLPATYKTKCEEKWNSHIDPEKLMEDKTFKQVKSWCTK